jgi:hypothetical protein
VRLDLTEVDDGVDFVIPGSTPAVRLRPLHLDRASGAAVSLVRFPRGWTRPGTGHYRAAEEFVVRDGALEVGSAYGPGDYAFLPPGITRRASRSEPGALVLAWFSSDPTWWDEPGPVQVQQPVTIRAVAARQGVVREPSPVVPGRFEVRAGSVAAGAAGADVFCPGNRSWEWLPAGRACTRWQGAVLVRQWG